MSIIRPLVYLVVALSLAWDASASRAGEGEPPSFNADVRPLLAARCFACHGPDEAAREAGLRLDSHAGATEDRGGFQAVAPGDAEASEMMRRVASDDEFEVMPPPEAGPPLTAEEIDLLRQWIDGGAEYDTHWAFQPPRRPPVPDVSRGDWPNNPIDAFVLHRLDREGLAPSPGADRMALVRRVYLDLTGLPPTPEEADAFAGDRRPDAYERLVDRLLDSEAYGERWARAWLDLARYADTNGYEKDRPRSIWPYRDWVIGALNRDMPFDRFTIEQLAGDMLPEATAAQRTATGFHRNTMLNEEGGIDPLEYRFYAMVDRVATTGTVWMGLSVGCAQCHTHKYDPVTHTDYYSLMALLNNADEPDLVVPDPQVQDRRRALEAEIARREEALPEQWPLPEPDEPAGEDAASDAPDDADDPGGAENADGAESPAAGCSDASRCGGEAASDDQRRAAAFDAAFDAWVDAERQNAAPWTVLRPSELETNLPRLELRDDGSIFSTGDITKRDVFTFSIPLDNLERPITALRLEVLPDASLPAGGPGRAYYEGRRGDFFLSEVEAEVGDAPVRFASATHSYGNISVGSGSADAENVFDGDGSTGWSTSGREGEPHQLVLRLAEPLEADGPLRLSMLFERHFAASLGRFRWSATTTDEAVVATRLSPELEATLARSPTEWTAAERRRVLRHFVRHAPELAEAREPIERLRGQLPEPPVTLVMKERPEDNPRLTRRHHRGEFLSPREEVAPAVPAVFPPLPDDQPPDRLTLARWLVSERNPLVARVTVNRAWQAFFGTGLMPTSGDFGTQAPPPTHPELLDWLAVEFVESGWSMKRLHRRIVTSRTYRQGSGASGALRKRDPDNRLLARGPRHRLDAEMIRDAALSASGRFARTVGGPSVYPPQPASVTEIAYGNAPWPTSTGGDRYRRSLYTFAKRTAPFAAYTVFDAPTGENCTPRRQRSNTPLQALTLLNDPMFVELSQALARRAAARQEGDAARLRFLFRRCLTRPPTTDELASLDAFRRAQLRRFEAGELDAGSVAGADGASAELASWAMVARVLMNLDETITKR